MGAPARPRRARACVRTGQEPARLGPSGRTAPDDRRRPLQVLSRAERPARKEAEATSDNREKPIAEAARQTRCIQI